MNPYRTAELRLGYGFTKFTNDMAWLVRDAINHGLEPEHVIAVMREAWQVELHDKTRRDLKSFEKVPILR